MAIVKISELPLITNIDANTANTYLIGLDISTLTTGKLTLTSLASGLYSNNALIVGNNHVLFPNSVAQLTGNSTNYIQVNIENTNPNGSSDLVATADIGTDTAYYVDLGINNSNYSYLGYQYAKPLDGYLIVQGNLSSPNSAGGNLVIGTTSTNRDIIFTQGTTGNTGQVARFSYAQGFQLSAKPLTFADFTQQNTAPWVAMAANSASTNAYTNSVITSNVFSLNSNSSNITIYATAAFSKANAALANISGTIFGGDLTISGNTKYTGLIRTNNNSYVSVTQPMVEFVGSTGFATSTPNTEYILRITGRDGQGGRLAAESYGTNAYSAFIGRSGRGTAAAPTATQNNDIIMRLAGNGFANTFSPNGTVRIDFVAAENYTDSTKGTRIEFWNTQNGTNNLYKIATFDANTASFSGYVTPQKGLIYNPRTFTASQTAITIDFTSDSLLRANIAASCIISFANYIPGKVVRMWITNISGTTQTLTHGTSAINSTVNSTTYNIPGTSTALVEYSSFGTDSANVLSAIIHV